MTPRDFRRIALSRPETVEVYCRGHSEFRLERKTFASLKGPADAMAMVNLTSEQQAMFMHAAPRAFVSIPSGWGRLGRTNVLLGFVQEAMLESSLAAAWCNVAPKSLLKRIDKPLSS
jgi:hypothetical protein